MATSSGHQDVVGLSPDPFGPPGGPEGDPIRVYVEGVESTRGLADLRDIDVSHVHSLRYLTAPEATLRWGRGHTNGAIVVTLRKR